MEREKIDLGNSNYKLLSDKKKIIDNSNVEEVKEGTFGAWGVNGKSYLFGEGARSKKNTRGNPYKGCTGRGYGRRSIL